MHPLLKNCSYRLLTPHLQKKHQKNHAVIGLSYHRFTPAQGKDPRPHMAITPNTFAQHLHWLNQLGSCISLKEHLNTQATPTLSFLLSFDDGYADNAQHLPDLLQTHNTPCTIYAVSDYISGKIKQLPHDQQANYHTPACSPQQLHQLATHPLITIGAHTLTHRILSTLTNNEIKTELTDSKKALEQIIQQPVTHFAAPSGQARDLPQDTLMDIAQQAGYHSLATNFGGYNTTPTKRPIQHIRRVPMTLSHHEWTAKGWALGGHNLREMRNNPTLSTWDQPEENNDPS